MNSTANRFLSPKDGLPVELQYAVCGELAALLVVELECDEQLRKQLRPPCSDEDLTVLANLALPSVDHSFSHLRNELDKAILARITLFQTLDINATTVEPFSRVMTAKHRREVKHLHLTLTSSRSSSDMAICQQDEVIELQLHHIAHICDDFSFPNLKTLTIALEQPEYWFQDGHGWLDHTVVERMVQLARGLKLDRTRLIAMCSLHEEMCSTAWTERDRRFGKEMGHDSAKGVADMLSVKPMWLPRWLPSCLKNHEDGCAAWL